MSTKVRETLINVKDGNNNAYDHFKKLIVKMAMQQEGIDGLEKKSFSLKKEQPKENVFQVKESFAHLKEYESKNRALLGKLTTGEEEPQEPGSLGFQPDFMEESQVFAKFGVGVGEDQTHRVFKSISRLSLKKNTKQIRFWGKILGSEKDYYVAEGIAEGGQEAGELSPDAEPKGTGVNKTNYWVTNELSGEWVELPVILPEQIKVARKIKYIFSGDLKRSILTNPKFNGTEAHLLKCQLVRISTTCTIIPKGVYVKSEDDPKQITLPEEQTIPSISELTEKQNWVYLNPSILKNGRTTLQKPEGLEGQEQEKWVKEMNEKDPTEPRLKSIVLDSENWSVKGVGIENTYKTLGKQSKVLSRGVVGVKSLLWPGWLTIGYDGKSSSIYMGYGQKFKQNYYPREPEAILQEMPDREQVVINE